MKKSNQFSEMNLGERMYAYEKINTNFLIPKSPVLVKINLKNLNNIIKQNWILKDHIIDPRIIQAFEKTTIKICEEVAGVEFAYYQKNKVLIFIKDYSKIEQTQYFGGNIQKICSDISSKFTFYFNKFLEENVSKHYELNTVLKLLPCFFTVCAYNIPTHEVINNFIFQQRESIKRFKRSPYANGFAFYKEAVIKEKSHPTDIKTNIEVTTEIVRHNWISNNNPPLFSKNKQFIERLVN